MPSEVNKDWRSILHTILPPELPHWGSGELHVIGLGTRLPQDLSLGALQCLAGAKRILTIEPFHYYHSTLSFYENKIESLEYIFNEPCPRHDMLQMVAKKVFNLALKEPGVAFALGGHPTISVAPIYYLQQMAKKQDMVINISPGVSSPDVFFSYAGVDPGATGVQILNAAIIDRLCPLTPVIVLCPGYAADISPRKRIKNLSLLFQMLQNTYGEHERFWLFSCENNGAKLIAMDQDSLLRDLILRPYLGNVLIAGPISLFCRTSAPEQNVPKKI